MANVGEKPKDGNAREKMMTAYYEYIGEAHIDNLMKTLEEEKDQIAQESISENLDKWFHNYCQEIRQKKNRIIA